jgi:putative nucleotidyltransferase with HDIG domain
MNRHSLRRIFRAIKSPRGSAEYRDVALRRGITLAANVAILLAALIGAVRCSATADWRPVALVVLLFLMAVSSDICAVSMRGIRISGDLPAIVLAMAVLGPAPAAAIGIVTALVDAIANRPRWEGLMNNLAAYTGVSFLGGLACRAVLQGHVFASQEVRLAAVVVGVSMLANALSFVMVAGFRFLRYRASFWQQVRRVYFAVLPAQFAAALLTGGIAYLYAGHGVAPVVGSAVVLFVFQFLLRSGVVASQRGEQLEERTRELASLQVGLLSTVLQTLSMRDAMTARHSAAVARYSREVAKMLGLSERDQDLIHTAALLHDIGKFIFPDSILFADRKLTDDEWQTVKLHPEQGAQLVRRIEGYGPVAEIVNHHHERFEGGGYPSGIAGEEIPIGSRIIAAADTYDVMTSRDSYRRPVSSEAALAELRRVAGSQLDPAVVDAFERMILERRVAFSHTDEADFESELAFERRVIEYARPRLAA